MADNTVQNATDTIATDDVTTLNGNASSGVKVQRVKATYGDDGTARDASLAFPMPMAVPNATVSGTITAANANQVTGTATANSTVTLTVPDHHSSWTATISGTFSAGTTLTFQFSNDGTNWWYTNGRRNQSALGVNETVSFTTTDFVGGAAPTGGNPSVWKGTAGSIKFFRVSCSVFTAADSINVRLDSSAGVGGTFLLGSIPAGTSAIGRLTPASTGSVTSVASSATSVTLLAANTARMGASIFNDSTANLFVALAATASTTAFTVRLAAGSYYELPDAGYTGVVSGIWATANGSARLTELS